MQVTLDFVRSVEIYLITGILVLNDSTFKAEIFKHNYDLSLTK